MADSRRIYPTSPSGGYYMGWWTPEMEADMQYTDDVIEPIGPAVDPDAAFVHAVCQYARGFHIPMQEGETLVGWMSRLRPKMQTNSALAFLLFMEAVVDQATKQSEAQLRVWLRWQAYSGRTTATESMASITWDQARAAAHRRFCETCRYKPAPGVLATMDNFNSDAEIYKEERAKCGKGPWTCNYPNGCKDSAHHLTPGHSGFSRGPLHPQGSAPTLGEQRAQSDAAKRAAGWKGADSLPHDSDWD